MGELSLEQSHWNCLHQHFYSVIRKKFSICFLFEDWWICLYQTSRTGMELGLPCCLQRRDCAMLLSRLTASPPASSHEFSPLLQNRQKWKQFEVSCLLQLLASTAELSQGCQFTIKTTGGFSCSPKLGNRPLACWMSIHQMESIGGTHISLPPDMPTVAW